ncbi:ubiquinol-cytochrome C chaperone [Nitratireductor mangrovi]|uniref:Ubiquinol-cytochrome C chaperone n=1 Tax=Nitratireductor mangrovi TaxID=2599600 RepID=A0A5B8L5I4_9HYPH|nr:ubiquinol-cytochrome C chaperone family protein [Nitratireductor mangrovi]QDZ03296.1 ubiquinol-cytochrome C chaperone [Nitratireductor mangrovi]
MFKRLFGLGQNPNRAIVDALYSQIVAASRQPCFYSIWQVPDTPLGRFEVLSLHVFLLMHRARDDAALKELVQELTDEFFRDVDHSLRELGIGDLGISKRMKRLARMFYGRAQSYGQALDAGDDEALAVALARNVRPDSDVWPGAHGLADYVVKAHGLLKEQDARHLLGGEITFPQAGLEKHPV